jgi:hypothetical protein
MPAVLSRRSTKLAVVLSTVAGALAFGGASSAQAGYIPCEWYDCVPVEIKQDWLPPEECRCPDIFDRYTDLQRFDFSTAVSLRDDLAVVSARFGAAGLQP